MINKPLPTFPSPGSRLGPPPGLMSSLELDALSQQAAQAGLLAHNLELLLRDAPKEACMSQQAAQAALLARPLEMLPRDAPAGAPRDACMQRYLQRVEQQRQLVYDLRADLQAVLDEQRGRLGEVRGPEASACRLPPPG